MLAVDQYLEALNVRAGSRILVNAIVEGVSTIQFEHFLVAATQITLLQCNAEIVSVYKYCMLLLI